MGSGAAAGYVQNAAAAGVWVIRVGAAQVEVDAVGGQGIHQVGHEAVRHRDGALLFDHRAYPGGNGDFQVGCRKPQHTLVAAEHDVLGYGQRGAAGNRAAHDAESASQIFLKARQFHGLCSRFMVWVLETDYSMGLLITWGHRGPVTGHRLWRPCTAPAGRESGCVWRNTWSRRPRARCACCVVPTASCPAWFR